MLLNAPTPRLRRGGGNAKPRPLDLLRADGFVSGPLKAPQKAYLWAPRNPPVSAVNSEMLNQQLVTGNMPLAGWKA